jgi:Fe-S cluster biogenesis protein NfuA
MPFSFIEYPASREAPIQHHSVSKMMSAVLSSTGAKEASMKERVQAAIDRIRPMLQRDGGDVELVDVQEGVVTVRLRGACAGCPMSQMTIKNGIEKFLKQEIPEIVAVQAAK